MKRLIPLFVVLLAVGAVLIGTSVSAQESASDESGGTTRVFDHFVGDGGPITWFVLIPLSVWTIALAVGHCLSIRRSAVIPDATTERLTELLEQKQYAEALAFSVEDDSVLAQVVHGGLSEASNGFAAMERAMEESLDERGAYLTRKIEYLNVIGTVSPMIGLFGTVYGMIKLFASIGDFGGNLDAGQIADDLSVALVTTFWGLLVAIPALSIFFLFRNRIEALCAECALVAEQLLTLFKPGSQAEGTGTIGERAS